MTIDNSIFEQNWSIYQKILQHNYMGHQQIYAVWETHFRTHANGHTRLLDIGCGDAQVISDRLHPNVVAQYVGIDLSHEAIALAQHNLDEQSISSHFIADDFVAAITSLVDAGQTFDVIFSGFALHHVSDALKLQLFSQIKQLLSEHGRFFFMDVYPQEAESREVYLERYLTAPEHQWQALSTQEQAKLAHHVRSSDFPCSKSTLLAMSSQAGFQHVQCLFEDTQHANILLEMR